MCVIVPVIFLAVVCARSRIYVSTNRYRYRGIRYPYMPANIYVCRQRYVNIYIQRTERLQCTMSVSSSTNSKLLPSSSPPSFISTKSLHVVVRRSAASTCYHVDIYRYTYSRSFVRSIEGISQVRSVDVQIVDVPVFPLTPFLILLR